MTKQRASVARKERDETKRMKREAKLARKQNRKETEDANDTASAGN